jgi:hypothetical protein
VRGWVDGETGLLVRDVQQKKLCGQPGVEAEFGTGYIPRDAFVDKSLARGVTDAYDTIQVKHYRSDGTPDGLYGHLQVLRAGPDEVPGGAHRLDLVRRRGPQDIYSEILTRTTRRRAWSDDLHPAEGQVRGGRPVP